MSWTFGLRNNAGKYLTAETFGHSLTANAPALKKKQIFTLEEEDGKVYIKTQTGRYLSNPEGDKITADAEVKTPKEAFIVHPQSNGQWAFETCSGTFFGGTTEKLDCFTPKMTVATLTPDRVWTMELATHPQICLKSVLRKQYAHLSGDSVTTDEDIPWGADAMITLNFHDGMYAFETDDGRFLSADGSLKKAIDKSTLFILLIKGDQVAFQSPGRGYLTVTGGKGKLNASKPLDAGIGKNELFIIEDSAPQLKFHCVSQDKKVSVFSGVQVSASQAKSEDTETFQLENCGSEWQIRCAKNTLLYIDGSACVMNDGKEQTDDANSKFTIEWMGDKLALKANNGKYVAAKSNGALVANGASIDDTSSYVFEIVNRPKLVLRTPFGFCATNASGVLRGNSVTAEVLNLQVTKGKCHISSNNGKFLVCNAAGIGAEGSAPEDWHFEFVGKSKMAIKVGDKYLQASQNGDIKPTGTSITETTSFEY